jgi:hypothetical protein
MTDSAAEFCEWMARPKQALNSKRLLLLGEYLSVCNLSKYFCGYFTEFG